MTLRTMTLCIMTLIVAIISIMSLSIIRRSTITLRITAHSIEKLSVMTHLNYTRYNDTA